MPDGKDAPCLHPSLISDVVTEDEWMAWLVEHGEDPPTHRVKVSLDIELDVILPPWTSPDDALSECLTSLGNLCPDCLVHEQWAFDDPQIVMPDGRIIGSVGSIEEALDAH